MSMAGFIEQTSEQKLSPDMRRLIDTMETATCSVQENLAPCLTPFHKGKGQRRKNRANRWKGPQGCMRN
jgi:hypothetical protein